jgi:hypothetical protein
VPLAGDFQGPCPNLKTSEAEGLNSSAPNKMGLSQIIHKYDLKSFMEDNEQNSLKDKKSLVD